MKPEMKFWTICFADDRKRVEATHLGQRAHWLYPAWIKAENTEHAAGYHFDVEEYHEYCKVGIDE